MVFMDNETGEIVMQNYLVDLDVETGECAWECVGNESEEPIQKNIRKTKFNVPKSYLTQAEPTSKEKCCLGQETFTLTSKKRVIDLKEVMFQRSFLRDYISTLPLLVKIF